MASPQKNSLRLQSVKHPGNVKVLILCENKTSLKEFYFIKTYLNLIKVDLSYNKLNSFPQGFSFGGFQHLKTVFLHYNKFSALKNLGPVAEGKSIIYLTLFGNPLEEAKARHLFVNQIPHLMLMDDKIVKIQERSNHLSMEEKETKVLPFPLLGEMKEEENTQNHLQNVVRELGVVRKHYLEVNPTIKIQRWWKHHLRLKDRRWKIVELPPLKRLESIMSNLEKSRTELGRLATQKMDIYKSKEEIVWSVLRLNWDFWTAFKQIVSQGPIYLSREYCKLNAIDYQQIQHQKIFNNFSDFPLSPLKNKKLLSFFIFYHNQIKSRNQNINQKQWKGMEKLKLRSIAKKLRINHQKSLITESKLEVLDEKYRYYVKPMVPFEELFKRAKKEYFVYQKSSLLGYPPEPYPFLFEKIFQRTRAAIEIQRRWRGGKVRQHINARLRIRQEEAAISIQRWIRNLKFQHRYKFLLQVSSYLKRQKNSNEIILQMQQIPAIEEYCRIKQTESINFVICFQDSPFSLSKLASISYYNTQNRAKIVISAERRPDPEYLNLTFRTDSSTGNLPESAKNMQKSNILDILFKYVKNIDRIIDKKGTKYVRFTYDSVQETLNRKFILALKTYTMMNHQFVGSHSCPQAGNQPITNLIDIVNEHRIVTLLSDRQKAGKEGSPEHAMKILQSQQSVTSLNSGINIVDDVITIKIKFFLGKVDYSCTLVLKPPNYNIKKLSKDTSLNSYREGYYLGRKKSHSKRYDDEYTMPVSKISRHVISLNRLDESQLASSRKNSVFYQKVLNTDQSHTVIDSLTPEHSLTKISDKFDRYDKFDKEIYPPATEVLKESLRYKKQLHQFHEIKQKRQLVSDIKLSHRQKITLITDKRSEQLSLLKQLKQKEQEQYEQKLSRLREQMQLDNHKKRDKIKKYFTNSSSDNFEIDFLKKGIKNSKKDMKSFQKNRSKREDQNNEHSISRTNAGKQVQKTEIKWFSMNFSQRDGMSIKISEHQVDATLERQQITSEISNSKHLLSNESKVKSVSRQKDSPSQHLKSEDLDVDPRFQQKKQLRKKRLVHSVFPQEFYPLKRSNQIGFELPKISKS